MAKKPDRSATVLRTAVVVLGMHRSGTSALARLVNFLGAALPRHLVPADQSNPRGHWESKPLIALHDELLAALDSSWDDWRSPGARWKESDAASRFSGRIRLAIDEEYGNAPLFVVKDPRLCRTLPYWMSILEKSGIRTAPLIIVRNPLEVAESLRVRNDISFEKAMLLWLRHTLDAEHETRHLQRNIVTFDALLEDWKLLAVQSGARLGITWPRQPALPDVREFLDNELHNHRATQAELEAHTEVPHWVKAAYRALVLLCDEPKSAEPKRELDKVRHAFAESAKIFGSVAFAQTDALKQAAIDVAAANMRAAAAEGARVRQLEGELATMTARATEFERVSLDFETALKQVRAEDYQRRAEEGEKRIAQLTKDIADVERRRAQAQQALTRVNQDAGELKALAKHLSERTEWIEGELKAQYAKSTKTTGELEEARAKALSALSNAVSMNETVATAKDQIHLHETRAIKAIAEARQHQEALAAARNRIAELEADERSAQADVSELRAELADAWARTGEVEAHIMPGTPSQVVQMTVDSHQATGTELVHATHDAEGRAQRIEEDLRFERMHVRQLERRLTTWMGLASAALRKITRLGGAAPATRTSRTAPARRPRMTPQQAASRT